MYFDLIFSVLMNFFHLLYIFCASPNIQSVVCFVCCGCVLTEKIREFNKFAVKRGGQEFSDKNISLVERLVRDNQCSSAATDVLWQMLQWPSGRFTLLQSRFHAVELKHFYSVLDESARIVSF